MRLCVLSPPNNPTTTPICKPRSPSRGWFVKVRSSGTAFPLARRVDHADRGCERHPRPSRGGRGSGPPTHGAAGRVDSPLRRHRVARNGARVPPGADALRIRELGQGQAKLVAAIKEIGGTHYDSFGALELAGKRIAWVHSHERHQFRQLENADFFDYVFYGHTHVREQHRTGKHSGRQPRRTVPCEPEDVYRSRRGDRGDQTDHRSGRRRNRRPTVRRTSRGKSTTGIGSIIGPGLPDPPSSPRVSAASTQLGDSSDSPPDSPSVPNSPTE